MGWPTSELPLTACTPVSLHAGQILVSSLVEGPSETTTPSRSRSAVALWWAACRVVPSVRATSQGIGSLPMTESGRPLRPAESASPAALPSRTDGPVPVITTSGRLLTKRPTCSQCRIRKVRCDGQHPVCGNCSRLRFECSFEQATRPIRSNYVLKVPEPRRRMQACLQ